ncbi:MAG: UDP-N-acetylmuramoyl-L-alanyl-D-glutamate--2,6-diaminopimelate ligase [Oscillospiraceae bacterium]|nr:UDP-N-acetylmuramoyl-L-alanyl-D-glutamate--2,6-diaminopimelate ligase [Oscillospiraceae bacterium]
MKLHKLLRDVEVSGLRADGETEITGVSCDSRTVQPGELFVAIPGEEEDGGRFIADAARHGAVCAVCEQESESHIPCVIVPSARRALAAISANRFDHPDRGMTLIGVTGTNGKTTSTYLIKQILEQTIGAKVGLVGTIRNMIGDRTLPAQRTTPDALELHRLLRSMADAGCTHAVMEVSSHALALERVWGLRFAVALFTNLTQDHLDFHQTMERYCDAKAVLFENCGEAVYNADDPWHERLLRRSICRRFSYGVNAPADLRAREICLHSDGVSYRAQTIGGSVSVETGIPGAFTVYNTLGAMASCMRLGISAADCAAALRRCGGVKGRMEVVPTPGRDYTVLIDYAHTPDALENVLTAAKGFAAGRTVALFGCGGDRDRAKRPQMGAIAARLADFSVVTTDNPRTEEPEKIIDDILAGMDSGAYAVIPDRTEAIYWALDTARSGDVIVLCGKGHETYQEVGHEKRHLDEREIVAAYFREK